MRRILTAVLASASLALALPAAASAHHHSHRHHHHRRHAHMVVFAPSAKPSGTTTPTAPTSEPVATVASFEGGVLKLTLADGSTVSGKVTEGTEIECGCGHQGFQGFQHDQGDDGPGHDQGDDNTPFGAHGSQGSFSDDDEQGQIGEGSCGTASLVPGAKVKEAELNVTGAGAVWEKVELLPQA